MNPGARRLFFALWPDAPVRTAIARAASGIARARALGGRELPDERLHLTLLFLGDVPSAVERRLVAGAAAIPGRAFDLTLQQAGCFYRSRVFWVGGPAPSRLTALHGRLRRLAGAAGIATDDRPLAPHVTCVRDIRHRIRPVPIEPIVWPVRSFALVHSTLGPRAEYHVVSHWPLQTGPGKPVKSVQEPGGPE